MGFGSIIIPTQAGVRFGAEGLGLSCLVIDGMARLKLP